MQKRKGNNQQHHRASQSHAADVAVSRQQLDNSRVPRQFSHRPHGDGHGRLSVESQVFRNRDMFVAGPRCTEVDPRQFGCELRIVFQSLGDVPQMFDLILKMHESQLVRPVVGFQP